MPSQLSTKHKFPGVLPSRACFVLVLTKIGLSELRVTSQTNGILRYILNTQKEKKKKEREEILIYYSFNIPMK